MEETESFDLDNNKIKIKNKKNPCKVVVKNFSTRVKKNSQEQFIVYGSFFLVIWL